MKHHVILFCALACWTVHVPQCCRAAPAAAPPRPVWIASPKSDDSIFMYRVGTAADAESDVRARQAAYADALRVIQDELLARAGIEDAGRPAWRALFAVSHAEPVPGAVHVEQTGGGFAAWVMVSCPLAERDRLLREITDTGAKLQAFFHRKQAAHAAMLHGDYDAALPLLRAIADEYAEFQAPEFALEEVRLMLGDAMCALNDPLAARACYETVAGMSASETWVARARERLDNLPRPPRLWPMRARWGGQTVAQLCVRGTDDRPPTPFGELAGALHRDFQSVQMTLKAMDAAAPDAVVRALDTRAPGALARAAHESGAPIALIIFVHTDTTRPGQTQSVMGVRMPVPDTLVRFMVLDAACGVMVYMDEFREMCGRQSDTRLAERVAAILINNYLVKKCPAIQCAGPETSPHE